jgi:hypothetical protein
MYILFKTMTLSVNGPHLGGTRGEGEERLREVEQKYRDTNRKISSLGKHQPCIEHANEVCIGACVGTFYMLALEQLLFKLQTRNQ